jgi:ATP-dependent DNA helicase RecQ
MVSEDKMYSELKKYFGYDSFRSFQQEAIEKVLNQEDLLTIMPTGGGKSLIFQLAAVLSDGMTIVVSPLIALMKDQVNSLTQNGIPAAYINSSLNETEKTAIYNQIHNKELKLLYVSPEKLLSHGFLDFLKGLDISFFAIDEAHCISSWGHDFRPEYTKLSALKQFFPDKSIVALTATADKQTRSDICQQLNISKENTFLDSFDRANLSLNVIAAKDRYKKIAQLLKKKPNESGIVYCLSRKSTEKIAEKLKNDGYKAAFYHAGLPAEKRNEIQDKFSNDEIHIIVATIAFGMGIDKSNIRWVIHYNLPKNMESYYQEIGRAGRDGVEADTYLFYSYGDIVMLKQFALNSGQADIQLAKLESMQKFAESQVCRRKILLNYFNEILEDDCGNCDVCANPPKTFDGTLIAQKALSASKRMKEFVGAGMIIDVLRGSGKEQVINNGYHEIKTFGAGKEIEWFAWQQYILQMIHQGLFEIDFARNQALKITYLGNDVLFGKRKIKLILPEEVVAKEPTKRRLETKEEMSYNADLFELLKIKRKDLAIEKNVPAFIIFSDKALKDMVKKVPVTQAEMLGVSGVGENKLQLYGEDFISVILQFMTDKAPKKKVKRGKKDSHLDSYNLYKEGKSLEEIAAARKLTVGTVTGHLIVCYEMEMDIDLYQLVSKVEIAQIIIGAKSLPEGATLKDIFEKLNEKFSYEKIKMAVVLSKE